MKPPLSIFVFIDALGWDLLSRRRFLDDVLPVRRPLETVLGYSATCIPTILTGRMPQEHGHFSFFFRSPDASPFRRLRPLSLLPKSLTDRGRVRRWMSRALQPLLGYTGYFQLYNVPFDVLPEFDYSEKRDLYQPGGINAGLPTIFDALRARDIPFHVSDWRRSEVDALGLRFGRDYVAMYDSTMARFWFLERGAEDRIRDLLHHEERGRVLSDADLAAFGCDFPDRRYGHLIFLARAGVLICPSSMGQRTMAGMHGYDPADVASTALFATNLPLERMPRRLDDLHGVMLDAVDPQVRSASTLEVCA